MARVVYTITDDADEQNSAAVANQVSITNTTRVFATGSASAGWCGFRVGSVGIPNSSTIQHAYLKVWMATISNSGANSFRVIGEKSANSLPFNTNTSNISARTVTTANSTIDDHLLPDGYVIMDVTAIVQEIVNQSGWAEGHPITLILDSTATSTGQIVSFSGTATPAELGIIYGGSASSVLTPTVSVSGTLTNPDNGWTINAVYATKAGTTDSEIYSTYGIPDLSASIIDGILVQVTAHNSSIAARCQWDVSLSWNAGSTFTSVLSTGMQATTDRTSAVGGAMSWGRNFIPSELTNANFQLKIAENFTSSNTGSLDAVSVQIFSHPAEPSTYFHRPTLRPRQFGPGVAR